MSQSVPPKAGPAISDSVREVQGIFPSDASLQDAIARLTLLGFDRADLSLPAASPHPAEATPELGAEDPHTEVDDRQMRTMGTSMAGAAGAMAAAGLTIATGGAAAVAIGAAAAIGAGAAALAHTASRAADQVQHDDREAAAGRGELVLSVLLRDPAKQGPAEEAMRQAGATRVAPVLRTAAGIEPAAGPPPAGRL
ncbi:MAG: hypothetical protein JO209_06385 [Acidisphaera sp.]|nr:hypothetical protein [Acidisphaera sp.]